MYFLEAEKDIKISFLFAIVVGGRRVPFDMDLSGPLAAPSTTALSLSMSSVAVGHAAT